MRLCIAGHAQYKKRGDARRLELLAARREAPDEERLDAQRIGVDQRMQERRMRHQHTLGQRAQSAEALLEKAGRARQRYSEAITLEGE